MNFRLRRPGRGVRRAQGQMNGLERDYAAILKRIGV